MKAVTQPDALLPLDTSWKAFSEAWKKARAKASEKSIHDLRVSTRRLIATLNLTQTVSQKDQIAKLEGRFKKVLRGIGTLRDVQVQLLNVSQMRQSALIVDFKRTLQRRERREIDEIGDHLSRRTKRRLAEGIQDARTGLIRLYNKLGEAKVRRAVDRIVTLREKEFLRSTRRLQPANEETLHRMRIALKKLRYAVEAAQPLLGDSAKQRARDMHEFQQLLGETRDIELLHTKLESWASKKGRKIAIVPVLDRLNDKRESLLKKIIEPAAISKIFPQESIRPAVEKTQIAPSDADKPTAVVKRKPGA